MPENITAEDVSTYNERLKLIKDKFEIFNDLVTNLVCDLDSANQTDQPKIATLEKQLADVLASVVNNEKLVKEKIQELRTAQPMSQAEQEKLELKRKQ